MKDRKKKKKVKIRQLKSSVFVVKDSMVVEVDKYRYVELGFL